MKHLLKLNELKVLYVEDDKIIRDEFSEMLSRFFGQVTAARNGADGLFIYQELLNTNENIDLIISDVDMPKMSGLELLEKIRENDNNIPFIFTTAHSQVDFLLKAISLNISDYLIKPINISALKSKVEILFGNIFKDKKKNNKSEELSEYVNVVNQVAIVSKTDKNGIITYVNDFFCEVSGFSKEELIGSNHNIVRHPNNSKQFYKNMWDELNKGNIWKGKIKNTSKNKEDYFLISTIIPIFDKYDEKIIEYVGVNFLTTEIEVKNREFKMKVMYNLQETKRININARKKIDDLQNELKKYKDVDLLKNAFHDEKKKNDKLIGYITSLEDDISTAEVKVQKITQDANMQMSKSTYILKQERFKYEYTISKFNSMQKVIEEKTEQVLKLNDELSSKNKKIIDLKDVIEHREDQLYNYQKSAK